VTGTLRARSLQLARPEDVSLLQYGVLQFTQKLHEVYHSTTGKIKGACNSLQIYNLTLQILRRNALHVKEEEQQLQEIVEGLKQVEEEELKNRSSEINSQFKEVLLKQVTLESQVKNMEQTINSIEKSKLTSQPQHVSTLKSYVKQQNTTLQRLLEMLRRQQSQITQQDLQLSRLEEQIETNGSEQ
uniref:Uncharacterized protein n=1 Tax=Latimeria chalumnae TaxID=7897 RepID=H3AWM3_LATCH